MPERPRLAVLIDAENLSAVHAEQILQTARAKGDAIVRRAFGNWQNAVLSPWAKVLTDGGFSAVQVASCAAGKNGADIALVISAMDLLHGGQVDGFVIASSDSDFTGLAIRLREQGVRVIGMGEAKTREAFRAACSEFVVLGAAAKPVAKAGNVVALVKPVGAATDTIRRAMATLTAQEGWYHLGALGQAMRKVDQSLRYRDYGHGTLKKLLEAVPMVTLEARPNGDVYVRVAGNATSASMQQDLCANSP